MELSVGKGVLWERESGGFWIEFGKESTATKREWRSSMGFGKTLVSFGWLRRGLANSSGNVGVENKLGVAVDLVPVKETEG